jgi:ABC-type antimicrobial peptide transport system permease subunit
MALGASAAQTIALVLRESVGFLLAGASAGLIAAILLTRSLARVLYGVGPFDLPSFALAAAVLLLVGLAASLIPARRATRVNPVVALRA